MLKIPTKSINPEKNVSQTKLRNSEIANAVLIEERMVSIKLNLNALELDLFDPASEVVTHVEVIDILNDNKVVFNVFTVPKD